MRRNHKILIAIIVVPLALLAARFLIGGPEDAWICQDGEWVRHGVPSGPPPESGCGQEIEIFTQEDAEELAVAEWGTCEDFDCDEMTVELSGTEGSLRIIATYDGLRDDSVRAMRFEAVIEYDDYFGSWILHEPKETWSCQPERGHQDWSDELCI